MSAYPVLLELSGRRVLVVGAGRIATRRLPRLMEAGADVQVVAPAASDRTSAVTSRPVNSLNNSTTRRR